MKFVCQSLVSLYLSLLSVIVYAADKAGDKVNPPVEQAGSGVVIGFFIFCVVGIAAWIFYTSKASKNEPDKKD